MRRHPRRTRSWSRLGMRSWAYLRASTLPRSTPICRRRSSRRRSLRTSARSPVQMSRRKWARRSFCGGTGQLYVLSRVSPQFTHLPAVPEPLPSAGRVAYRRPRLHPARPYRTHLPKALPPSRPAVRALLLPLPPGGPTLHAQIPEPEVGTLAARAQVRSRKTGVEAIEGDGSLLK